MQAVKFMASSEQFDFLRNYQMYGFKNKSAMMRAALDHLMEELEVANLVESAKLYAEIYENDSELQELTGSAIVGWPE